MGVFRPPRRGRFILNADRTDGPSGAVEFDDLHFVRLDETPDEMFYSMARLVTHIDEAACAALAAHYDRQLTDGSRILDLMSSCVSHLPDGLSPASVVGHGMNTQELAANPQLDSYFVQNLNKNPELPFEDGSFDACLIAVSVQYLTDPVRVFAEIGRILAPGGVLIVSFSNRMFPTKAVAIWRSLDDAGHQQYVAACMEKSGGFAEIGISDLSPMPGRSDPLFSVEGRTPD
ncbi:MAG: class I SAM-dependent methyltransferase [Alphaproteobacteria bacterium]